MADYTYETENRGAELETYEWDDIWFEQANLPNARRILYIGDSISCGMRKIATEMSAGKFLFDGLGTSKAVDNPFYPELIALVARQQATREVVLFNNGLHGFHLSTEAYAAHYERLLQFLMTQFSKEKLVLLLTTSVEGSDNDIVLERNQVVCALAEKYHLPTIDLYHISFENRALLRDGIHMTNPGYERLVEFLLRRIDEITAN